MTSPSGETPLPGPLAGRFAACVLAAGAFLAGCGPSGATGDSLAARLQHEDPKVRAEAAFQAGQEGHTAAVPLLIDRLTDSEADVRFFSILALRRLSERHFGYRYFDPPEKRYRAQQRWRAWAAGEEVTETMYEDPGEEPPADAPATAPAAGPAPAEETEGGHEESSHE